MYCLIHARCFSADACAPLRFLDLARCVASSNNEQRRRRSTARRCRATSISCFRAYGWNQLQQYRRRSTPAYQRRWACSAGLEPGLVTASIAGSKCASEEDVHCGVAHHDGNQRNQSFVARGHHGGWSCSRLRQRFQGAPVASDRPQSRSCAQVEDSSSAAERLAIAWCPAHERAR